MQLALTQISEPLRLWEKLEIVVAEGDDQGPYLAHIEDFMTDGIVISNPVFKEGRTLLKDNCEVVVLVIKEDAVYQFYSLLYKMDIGGKTLFILTLPREIQRVQRREFVRVEVIHDVSFANLGAKNVEQEITWHDTVSINFSGGGLALKTAEDIEPPNTVLLKIPVFSKLNIAQPVVGICRRTFYVEDNHYTGVELIRSDNLPHYFYTEELKRLPKSVNEFDHAAQNRVVNYVFQQQIELRKKGLI